MKWCNKCGFRARADSTRKVCPHKHGPLVEMKVLWLSEQAVKDASLVTETPTDTEVIVVGKYGHDMKENTQ